MRFLWLQSARWLGFPGGTDNYNFDIPCGSERRLKCLPQGASDVVMALKSRVYYTAANVALTMSGSPMSPLVLAADGDWSLTMPLWLPYVIFTVVLLSLIVVSFARFHALRGAQYRNRQLADERSIAANGAKNGFVSRQIYIHLYSSIIKIR